MDEKNSRGAAAAPDAVGIVVRGARPAACRPRAAVFVWGMRIYPAPSLPFGRWKAPARPGAGGA